MKTVVAGSRWIWDRQVVYDAIRDSGFEITELVSGCNRGWDEENNRQIGVDGFGEDWAVENYVLIKPFPANWDKYKKAAGPMRNRAMAAYADALILVWDGQSRGSASMLQEARSRGLKIFVVEVEQEVMGS